MNLSILFIAILSYLIGSISGGVVIGRLKNVDIRTNDQSCEDIALIFDLQSSLISAEATILSALEREENYGTFAFLKSMAKKFLKNDEINFDVRIKPKEI